MNKLRIFGAGVRATLLTDLISWEFADRFEIEGYYCDVREKGTFGPRGFPILGTISNGLVEVPRDDVNAFICFGTYASAKGCRLFVELREQNVSIPSFVSSSAHIFPSADIGLNAVVFPGVYIGCDVRIGHLFWAHGGCAVEHHCSIGHNVQLGVSVAISGYVTVGSHCFLGTGSRIGPETTIGSGTLVGAGSLVVRDISPHVIAYGQPAVVKRRVTAKDEVPTKQEVQQLAISGLP